MKMEPPKNRPDTLKCVICDYSEKAPFHCGAPMHIEDDILVCWMLTVCVSSMGRMVI